MRLLLARLRELIWPAVLAAVLVAVSILTAIFIPNAVAFVLATGLSSIAMALLANRA